MERLTEKDWKDKCAGYPWNVHPVKDIDDLPYYKKLAAYEDLGYTPEELKLCFDPPEVLYEIGNETDGERVHPIYPVDGEQIEFAKGDAYWNCRDSFGDCVEIPLGGLHKEYFLDSDEAEAQLKEMQDNNDKG